VRSRFPNAAAATAAFLFAAAAGAADPNLCVACHGDGGNSANPEVPSISQQPAQFLSTALFMYREGYRKEAQMAPMAAKLSNAEMNELAAYFAKQAAAAPRHQTSAANLKDGPAAVQKFNCAQCHGPRLLGLQHIPRLAGQQFQYLRAQLRAFKAGKRGDLDGKMSESAQPLSDRDIEVLADYLAGLVP